MFSPELRIRSDEWATAGEVATGLDRARVALALASSWSRHAAAEGVDY